MEDLFDKALSLIILVVIIAIAIIAAKITEKNKAKKIRRENLEALQTIANVMVKLSENLNASTDLKSKKARAENIIQTLDSASQYPEYREVFTNFDEMYDEAESMILVAPVIEYLEKAHKFRFKKKDSSEKNALLDAMYEIDQNNITNDDFERLGSHDEETGEIISVTQIEKRLKELGWER